MLFNPNQTEVNPGGIHFLFSFSRKIGFSFLLLFSLVAVAVPPSPGISSSAIVANSAGGRWDATATWVGGVVPGPADKVVIPAGTEVIVRGPYTLASPAACRSLTIQGTLTLGSALSAGARGLQVDSTMVIASGGLLRNDGADTHSLILGGDLVVDGQVSLSSPSGFARVVFTGIQIQAILGSSPLLSLRSVTVDKIFGEVNGTGIERLLIEELSVLSGDFFSADHTTVVSLLKVREGNFITGDTLMLSGNVDVTDGSISSSAGKFILNGQSQTIVSLSEIIIHDLIVSSGVEAEVTAKMRLTGELLIEDGAIFKCGNGITVSGATKIGQGKSGEFRFVKVDGTKTFVGPVLVMPGALWNNSIGDNTHFQGGINNQGNFNDGTGTNYFEAAAQEISGNLTFKNTFTEPGIVVTNKGDVSITTAFAGPGGWKQGAGARLNLGGTITADLLEASAEGNTVVFSGADQKIPKLVYHHLIMAGTGVKTLQTGLNTINGDLLMTGSTQSSTKEAFLIGGKLTIGDGNQLTVTNAFTVTGATTIGTGVGGSLLITAVAGTKTFSGKLTIAPNAIFSNTANDNVHYQAGIAAAGTFLGGTAVHYFETNSQEITGTISVNTVFLNTNILVTNNGTVTVSNLLTGSGTFSQGPAGVLNLGGTVDVRKLEFAEAGNTVNFIGGNQTIPTGSFFNLGFSGTATAAVKTLQPGSSTVRGNLSIAENASVTTVESMTIAGNLSHTGSKPLLNGHTLSVNGAISGTGIIEQAAAAVLNVNGQATGVSIKGGTTTNTVNYKASSPTILGGQYSTVQIPMTGGNATLQGDASVASVISIGSGTLTLGSFNLTLGLTAVLDIPAPSASSMIITNGTGELRKSISATGTYSFPVGEAEGTAEYTPVTIEVSAGTGFSQAVIGVSTANSKSPSNFSAVNYLNRFWKLYQSGITGCVITFNSAYAAQDVIGQASSIRLASFSGQYNAVTNAWKKIGPIENNAISQGGIQLPAQVSTFITGIGVTTPIASITGGNGPAVCIGSSVSLAGSFTGEGTPSYVWTPAIGLTAPSAAQTLAAPAATTTYTLTVFDANGASATASTVVAIQQPTVTAANAEVCTGGSVTLTAAGAVNYAWSPSSGLSAVTGGSVTATLSQTAEYLVIGTDASGCADSVRVKVTVNPFPGKAGITGQGLLSDRPVLTSSSATGNQWYRNGTILQGATGSTYTATESGTYSVRVTAKNCTGPASDDFVLVIVGMEGETSTGRIYPNPSDGPTTLDLNGFDASRMVTVSVRDAQGKLMVSRLVDTSNPMIDVTDFPSGMYVITAQQGVRRVVRKIMRR